MKVAPQKIALTIEDRQFLTLPATVIGILLNGLLIVQSFNNSIPADQRTLYLEIGLGSSVYIAFLYGLVLPIIDRYRIIGWAVVVINGVFTGGLYIVLPAEPTVLPLLFSIIVIAITAILSGRAATYVFIGVCTLMQIALMSSRANVASKPVLMVYSLPLLGIIITETILRLQEALLTQLKHLETLNRVARNLATSLETPQVLALLSSAIQNSFQADTYYLGLLKKDKLALQLLYDDGEFFPPVELPLENTMAGWAIYHKQALLVKDFDREAVGLGIHSVIVGKTKGSNSWMGAPIFSGGTMIGLAAVASYKRNAFTQADMELLQNIAQQAGLAIDNTYHHAEVEMQSHLDSLTEVYNHGYFLTLLEQEARQALQTGQCLALIMLDIDYFKQYNDRYGHLAGDEILSLLTQNIRRFIHNTDLVGRWGGEEFVICLPNTTIEQAYLVAERIRQSMNSVVINRNDHTSIPSPTVSQGIAIYPDEAREIYRLIDLADQRLYAAKERGRNQIEAAAPLSVEVTKEL